MLSFIVPAHNEENELPETLRAIDHAAEIAGEEYEIVVVVDDSTDWTAKVAQLHGARVIRVHLRQIGAVRNAGARAARGDTLFFIDADTRISPGHVTEALKALAAGHAGGSARVEFDSEIPPWAHVYLRMFSAVYFSLNLGVGAFMFARRETFQATGGFDEQYFAGEEAFLSMALKKLGPFKILPEPIVTSARKIRMHPAKVVLAQSMFIFFGGQRALRKREKLDLWYDGKRERNPA